MFVHGSIQFIRNNIVSILLMVLILFLTTSFFVMHKIIFPKSSPVLEKVIVVENFTADDALNPTEVASDVSDRLIIDKPTVYDNSVLPTQFCSTHVRDLKAGHDSCRQLKTSDTCNLTSCCIWASHKKDGEGCVGGDHLGPTFDAFDYKPDYLFSGKKHTI